MSETLNPIDEVPLENYSVELRIYGDKLNPAEITERLNLQPSITCQSYGCGVGNRKEMPCTHCGAGRRKGKPFWGYDGHDARGYQFKWASLDEGIAFLLGHIDPVHTTIIELSQDYFAYLWCGHFQSCFSGNPSLSPESLNLIARYELFFYLDNDYHYPQGESSNPSDPAPLDYLKIMKRD